MRAFAVISSLLLAIIHTASTAELAVYWGQNSVGATNGNAQKPLAHYCSDPSISRFLLAFLTILKNSKGNPEINFGNQQAGCNETAQTFVCSKIGDDIKTCQKSNKTVLLSIGGDTTAGEMGWSSVQDAKDGAKNIWQMFGPKTNSTVTRPFADAVVDGFDLDLEAAVNPAKNFQPFVEELRVLMDETSKTSGKKYTFSATPECPDTAATNTKETMAIIGNTKNVFDIIQVQYYNNPACEAGTNLDTWGKKATDHKQDAKFVPVFAAGAKAAGSGYLDPSNLANFLKSAKGLSNYAGAVLWDISQADANSKYQDKVKSAL